MKNSKTTIQSSGSNPDGNRNQNLNNVESKMTQQQRRKMGRERLKHKTHLQSDSSKSSLPSWFLKTCVIYDKGGYVFNPLYRGSYSNPVWLNPIELSVYDFIKGVEMFISLMDGKQFKTPYQMNILDESIRRFHQCLYWFRKNDNKKYLTLLD